MTQRDKRYYHFLLKTLSDSFDLCNECKVKIPSDCYATTDGGSGTLIIKQNENPLIGCHPIECFFMCNTCYDKNLDLREKLRLLRLAYNFNIEYDFFRRLMDYLDYWLSLRNKKGL